MLQSESTGMLKNCETRFSNDQTNNENSAESMIRGLCDEVVRLQRDMTLMRVQTRFAMNALESAMKPDERFCPVCETVSPKFVPHGVAQRLEAKCPCCGALERHRLMWLFIQSETNLFRDPLRFLHFAPEKGLLPHFRKCENLDYVTVDIEPGRADYAMDIQNLGFPDNSFDALLCSHVLEHIPDDRRATRELLRVLKPGGWALIAVPINHTYDVTYEDPNVKTIEDRIKHYGHPEHLRWYGKDVAKRLMEDGFEVSVNTDFANCLEANLRRRMNVNSEWFFLCRKPRR